MPQTTASLPTFGTFTATVAKTNTVAIPDDVRADFVRACGYFDGQPNTTILTVALPSEAEAKLFGKRVVQFGKDTDRSTAGIKVTGTVVSFRFAKVRKPKPAKSPVTVTHVTDAA